MYRIIIPDEDERFIDLNCLDIVPIYKISNYGNIINKYTSKMLKPQYNNSGYLRVSLMTNSHKTKKFFIHRLVALMFIQNNNDTLQVNHITEGHKDFNYYKNLEWVTASDNQLHHYMYGDSSKQHKGNKTNHYKGEDRYNANISEKLVRKICKMLENKQSILDIRDKICSETNLTNKQLYAVIYHLKKKNSWKDIIKDYNY